jgi:ribonuclease R
LTEKSAPGTKGKGKAKGKTKARVRTKAKPTRTAKSKPGFPTREDVLTFVAQNPGKTGKREIARQFGITGSGRIKLKALLKTLVKEGAIQGRKKRLAAGGTLPSVTVLEVTGRDGDGDLVAIPADWPEDQGDPPRARIEISGTARGRDVPGVGDRVLGRLQRDDDTAADYVARVIKVLDRQQQAILGVVQTGAHGPRLELVERRQKEVALDPDHMGAAQPGDLVAVTVGRENRYGLRIARVSEVIGSMRDEKAVSLIALHALGIPIKFDPDVIAAADAAQPATAKGREDWRDRPLVTIDPADAKDRDDAVFAEPDPDTANPGGYIVSVAIADVAHYVRPRSPLDRTALERGNSVYFPDRVVPMLPERISNDLCSLHEGVDRPALAVRMVFSSAGSKIGHQFHRVLMKSAASLSYQQAQEAFDGDPGDLKGPVAGALTDLLAAYQCLAQGRDARGPLDLDLPERKIILNDKGTIDRVMIPPRLDAHRLIEEFMIQANVAAAETLEQKKSPLIYRIHDNPSMAKMEALREFLKSIKIELPKGGNIRPELFNRILSKTKATEHGPLLSEVVLRTQSQAEYNPDNIGHFGLNLRRYAHFTSPIRRYADLIVHRALIRGLGLGPDGLADETVANLSDIAVQISGTERRAMVAERQTTERLIANWLADRIGAVFAGRIAGVTGAGLFVKLDETGADGFVPISTLGDEYFRFDEARRAVIGERTGIMHRLGDAAEVRLLEAVPLTGGLRFELLSEGKVLPRAERPANRRGSAGGKRPAFRPHRRRQAR